jgi:DNA gyrase/topoisomerase IV subunit B
MFPPPQPLKLVDCQAHGADSNAELFIVEGDSAALSVCALRNPAFQAVLPMQGKPMNTLKSREDRVKADPFFAALIAAIGTDLGGYCHVDSIRYRQINLLFDPDADGIHSSTLMLLFFYRWMKPLMEAGRLMIIRAPMMEIVADELNDVLLAYTEEEGDRLCRDAAGQRKPGYRKQRFRGLASFDADLLIRCCIDPATRKISRLTARDAEESIRIMAVFGAEL